jgi:O-antigen/teichoic acid export membrane protein
VAELLWVKRASPVQFPNIPRAIRTLWRFGGRWKSFGIFHCGNQVFNAVGGNAPTIILGAALSKASAAAFSMANWLVTIPIYILIGALHRVAFSALAGRSREGLVSPVLQMLRMSAAFIVPVLIWVAIMAEPIVAIVLGEKYLEMTAPVARWLSLYCVFAALFSPVSSLDVLLDRTDYGFYWNVVATALRVAAVFLGLHYSVMAAVAAYGVVSAVMWIIWGVMLARLLGAGQWAFHRAWLAFTPVWLFLGLLLWGVTFLIPGTWASLFASIVPVAIYAGALWIGYPEVARLGIRLVKVR